MAPLRAGHTTAPLAGLGIGRDRPRELQPGENLDVVVEHVLQELDWHYLAVRGASSGNLCAYVYVCR